MRYIAWAAVLGGLGLVAFTDVPAPYVLGPLVGLAIARVGFATFASLRRGAAHIPDGDARPVDPEVERVTYWCEACGAELLLLARGTALPPRHCGERMAERHEIRHTDRAEMSPQSSIEGLSTDVDGPVGE